MFGYSLFAIGYSLFVADADCADMQLALNAFVNGTAARTRR